MGKKYGKGKRKYNENNSLEYILASSILSDGEKGKIQETIDYLKQLKKTVPVLSPADNAILKQQATSILTNPKDDQLGYDEVMNKVKPLTTLAKFKQKITELNTAIRKCEEVVEIYKNKKIADNGVKEYLIDKITMLRKLISSYGREISFSCRVAIHCLYNTGSQSQAEQIVADKDYKNALVVRKDENYCGIDMLGFFDIVRILEKQEKSVLANNMCNDIMEHIKDGAVFVVGDSDGANETITDRAYNKLLNLTKNDIKNANGELLISSIIRHFNNFMSKMQPCTEKIKSCNLLNDLSCNISKSERENLFFVRRRGVRFLQFLEKLFKIFPVIKLEINPVYAELCYYIGTLSIFLRDREAINILLKVDDEKECWGDAQISIAALYRGGVCIEEDLEKAISIYEKVAQNPCAAVQNRWLANKCLGEIFFCENAKTDIKKAIAYFEAAMDLEKDITEQDELTEDDKDHLVGLLVKACFKLSLDENNIELYNYAIEILNTKFNYNNSDAANTMLEIGMLMIRYPAAVSQGLEIIEHYSKKSDLDILLAYNLGIFYLSSNAVVINSSLENSKECAKQYFERVIYSNSPQKIIGNRDVAMILTVYESSCENLFEIYKNQATNITKEDLHEKLRSLEEFIEGLCGFARKRLRSGLALRRAVTGYIYRLLELKDEIYDFKNMKECGMSTSEINCGGECIVTTSQSATVSSSFDNSIVVSEAATSKIKTVCKADIELASSSDYLEKGRQGLNNLLNLLEGDVVLDIDTFAFLAKKLDSIFVQEGAHRENLFNDKLNAFFRCASMFVDNTSQKGFRVKHMLALTASICSMYISSNDKLVNSILKKSYRLIAENAEKLSFWQVVRIVHFSAKTGIADDCHEDFSIIMAKLLTMLQERQAIQNIEDERLIRLQEDIYLLYKVTALINSLQPSSKLYDIMLSISNNLRRSIEDDRELLLEQSDEEVFLSLISYNVIARFFEKDINSSNLDALINFLQEANKKTKKHMEQLVHTSYTQGQIFDLLKVYFKDKLKRGYSLQEEVSLEGLPPEDICLYEGQKLMAVFKVDGVQHNLFAGKGDVPSLQPEELTPKDKLRDAVLAKLFPGLVIIHIPVKEYDAAKDKLQWLRSNVGSHLDLKNSSSKNPLILSSGLSNGSSGSGNNNQREKTSPTTSPSCCC